MTDIIISTATLQNKDKLLSLFKHYDHDLGTKRVECYLSHNHTIIAKNGDQIVGILQWLIKEDPNLGVAEFEEISVIQEYRGQGIGSKIIQFAINEIVKYFIEINIKPRRIYLFVNQNNSTARHLYEKLGFQNIANLKNIFSNTENELFYIFNIEKK